jgi:hypothetical protein
MALVAVTLTTPPVVTIGFGMTGQTVGWTAGQRVAISGQTVGMLLVVHWVASFGQVVGSVFPGHVVLIAGQTVYGVFGHWVNPIGEIVGPQLTPDGHWVVIAGHWVVTCTHSVGTPGVVVGPHDPATTGQLVSRIGQLVEDAG